MQKWDAPNYYKTIPLESVLPAQMLDAKFKDYQYGDLWEAATNKFLAPTTATKAPAKIAPDLSNCEVTDEAEFFAIYEEALQAVKDSDEPMKLTELITSRRKRLKYADRLIAALDEVPEIDYTFKTMGNSTSHFFSWMGNEVKGLSWDMLEENN